MSELPYSVAVVVLTTVEAVDYADAAFAAEKAVKQTLGRAGTWSQESPHLTIHADSLTGDYKAPVGVLLVELLDIAFRSGRIYPQPAYKPRES